MRQGGTHSLAIITRSGHNNEPLLPHLRMLAEKLRPDAKTQLAKLTLGLRSSRFVSERITRSYPIDQQSKILWNFLRPRAQNSNPGTSMKGLPIVDAPGASEKTQNLTVDFRGL